MQRDPNCQLCALHKSAQHVCLLGKGPRRAKAMIIGEAPGQREDDIGRPFVGRAGRVLDALLGQAGINRDDVFITNAVSCRPPDNRTPKKSEIEACKKWLDYQISVVKPKFLLLLGNVPLLSVLGLKGIKKLRGRPIEHDGMIILPTFHPSYVLHDERQMPKLLSDVLKFKSIIDFDGIPRERDLNVTVVDTWNKFHNMIDAMTGIVSYDIETTCLYPWAPEARIVTIGIGTSSGEFVIPVHHRDTRWVPNDIDRMIDFIEDRLEDCFVVMQNGKFDALWSLLHYNIKIPIHFDTMLAHYCLDENALHDLESLAKLYYGAHDWDIPLKEKQGDTPIQKLAQYQAHDLFYTRKLYFTLKKLLAEDHQVQRVFEKILMPCANLFATRIEPNGCYIDTDQMARVEKHLKKVKRDAEKRLKKWGDINWASPQQVAKVLYGDLKIPVVERTPKGAASTSESCLKRIEHPAVADLLTFRGAKQQLSFFIDGWKPYIVNGYIHPSFKLHGTVTGRLSCEHPNFQQVPRDPIIRSLVSAPDGWKFMEGDLSQIELRIAAELSRCPAMMQAFRSGTDVHWLTALTELQRGAGMVDLIKDTACTAMQVKNMNYNDAIEVLLKIGPDAAVEINKDWKEVRKKAKAVNFGYIFGMWWKKFKVYARDNYGLTLTDDEARESREAFFDLYPIEGWHKRQKGFAQAHGFVRSLSGRKRRLPDAMDEHDTPERAEAQRQAINSPVQSFANELNLMCLIQLCDEFPNSVFRPCMTVHDQVGARVKQSRVIEVGERWEQIMKGPDLLKAFDIHLSVPICGEVKIGPWGKGVSLDKWRKQHAI